MSYITVSCTSKTRFTNNLKEIIKGEFLGSLCKIVEGSRCHKKPDEYHFLCWALSSFSMYNIG